MGTKGEKRLPPRGSVGQYTVDHYTITPDDITSFLNAEKCHEAGITGEGITVGIIDSGWYDHEYFEVRKDEFKQKHDNLNWQGSGKGWNSPRIVFAGKNRVGNLPNPETDTSSSSHGTGMAANLLSVAPGVRLRLYSRDKQSFLGQLESAVEQCDIISISKAHDGAAFGRGAAADGARQRYKDAFIKAKQDGKVVFHANGNKGSLPWPIEHCTDSIIKVGGVYRDANKELQAANYAMAHGNSRLPDICGLCGMYYTEKEQEDPALRGGAYIWLPGDPDNDTEDFPSGWGLHSGTSSATPQVAGACALMAHARKMHNMSPLNMETTKSILRKTATAVTRGKSADGIDADDSWCLLVDAAAAVKMAIQ